MFFLAFQEYLQTYKHKDIKTITKQEIKRYRKDYQNYCKKHHLCDNLYDFYNEWKQRSN